jgi:hypothetical protein
MLESSRRICSEKSFCEYFANPKFLNFCTKVISSQINQCIDRFEIRTMQFNDTMPINLQCFQRRQRITDTSIGEN